LPAARFPEIALFTQDFSEIAVVRDPRHLRLQLFK
jgi:hypothetical protein